MLELADKVLILIRSRNSGKIGHKSEKVEETSTEKGKIQKKPQIDILIPKGKVSKNEKCTG